MRYFIQAAVTGMLLALSAKTLWHVPQAVADVPADQVAPDPSSPQRAALFVKNEAGAQFADSLDAFEDVLVSGLADIGFRLISPGDTTMALQAFSGDLGAAEMDMTLEANTSALRLSQNMGADYVFVASLTAYGVTQQRLTREDLGIDRLVSDHQLTASYRLLDSVYGDAVAAGSVQAVSRVQQSQTLSSEVNVANALLIDAANRVVADIASKGGSEVVARLSQDAALPVEFSVYCSIQDMTVPEVLVDSEGELILTGNRYVMEPLSVTVELDGVVIGSAPGEFRASPGLHKMRLSREGFEDWERMINITEGQSLRVAMTLSEQGRAQWYEMASFFAGLKERERISRAEKEVMEGFAEMMRESGIKIDIKAEDGFWK